MRKKTQTNASTANWNIQFATDLVVLNIVEYY